MAVIDGYALDEDISPVDGSAAYGAGGYGLAADETLFPGDNAMAYGAGGYGFDADSSPPSNVLTYRMRGFDTSLARIVFWLAPDVDDIGAFYAGPGPLADIVVQKIIGQ